jgi:hypothetical protein
MSYTASVAWSHLVLPLCCTEPDLSHGAVLSGCITTVVMSMSGQLSMCCTVESNCSGMSVRLAAACPYALHTSPAACLGQLCPSLFLWFTIRWGPWGTWQHRSSPQREARLRPRGSAGAHLGREVRSEAEEHVAAPEFYSQGGRVWSHGTRGSAGAHLGREARSGAKECVAAPKLNSARRRGPGPRATW